MRQTAMRTSPWAPPELQPSVTAVVIISGLFMLAFGLWAFFAPASFAEFVAFPYNRHLAHDGLEQPHSVAPWLSLDGAPLGAHSISSCFRRRQGL